MNAIATFHDALNIKLGAGVRESSGNIFTMVPSAFLTLGALYNQINCPTCFK